MLRKLRQIELLEREGAEARDLLAALRALVGEAEAWAAHEGDERALRAVERCREAVDRSRVPV